MVKDNIYSDEELKYFESIEEGNYSCVSDEEFKKYKSEASKVAKNTLDRLKRKKSINLRVYENDIKNIKAIALNKGLPYQTFLASIIHQVATKQIEV